VRPSWGSLSYSSERRCARGERVELWERVPFRTDTRDRSTAKPPSIAMELLEREQGLRELGEAFAQALRSEGRLVLVAGEAGIGKTALVEHFLKTAQPAEVLVGVCDALFTPRPLGPLRDIALQWSDPAPLDPETDRHRLFSSVLRYFRQRSAPVVAVFEDVHWADEATLDLIKSLGRRIARLPALIVLTYRDDEVGPRHPLRSVLGDLPRASTSRIHLEQLSESAVRHLANDVPNAVSGALYALTSGNPFFVTELLASSDEGVPATLRDAILARAARLGAAAREALDLASLSPVAIEPWLIEACLPGGSALLDACAAHGMLKPMGARYAFRHELARLGVRDALSPQQRQALSLRLLRALESPPLAPDALSRLAHHAEEVGDDAAVLKYAAAAGRSAVSLGAHREAVARVLDPYFHM